MPTKSIFVTDETETIVKQLERGNESHIYREAIRAFDRLLSLLGNQWESELHYAGFALKRVREAWQEDWPDNLEEAILALKLVREIFGPNWQEEWQKIKDVAEKM